MSAFFGIDSTYGITVPAGATVQTVDHEQSAEISELQGEDGEIKKASTTHVKKVTVDINLVGTAGIDTVVPGNVASPSSLEIISVEQGERVNNRPTAMIKAAGYEGIDDGSGSGSGAGAGSPDEDTLEVVSVDYALAQDVKISPSVMDEMIPGVDGHPALRQKVKLVNTLDFSFAGDIPSGVALGTGGAGAAGLTGGKLIVQSLKEKQEAGKFNSGSASAKHYPAAA